MNIHQFSKKLVLELFDLYQNHSENAWTDLDPKELIPTAEELLTTWLNEVIGEYDELGNYVGDGVDASPIINDVKRRLRTTLGLTEEKA